MTRKKSVFVLDGDGRQMYINYAPEGIRRIIAGLFSTFFNEGEDPTLQAELEKAALAVKSPTGEISEEVHFQLFVIKGELTTLEILHELKQQGLRSANLVELITFYDNYDRVSDEHNLIIFGETNEAGDIYGATGWIDEFEYENADSPIESGYCCDCKWNGDEFYVLVVMP